MYFNPVNKQLEEHKVFQQREKWGNFIQRENSTMKLYVRL